MGSCPSCPASWSAPWHLRRSASTKTERYGGKVRRIGKYPCCESTKEIYSRLARRTSTPPKWPHVGAPFWWHEEASCYQTTGHRMTQNTKQGGARAFDHPWHVLEGGSGLKSAKIITQERAYDPSWIVKFYTEKGKSGSWREVWLSGSRIYTIDFAAPYRNSMVVKFKCPVRKIT